MGKVKIIRSQESKLRTVRERLEASREIFVSEDGQEHWLWLGSTNSKGYGHIRVDDSIQYVHRVSYKLYNGVDLPNDLMVLHKPPCDIRNCFNPAHLYSGDAVDNMQDRLKAGHHNMSTKTHCPQGHEYTPENTYTHGTRRHCRICNVMAQNRHQKKLNDLNRSLTDIERQVLGV